MKLRHLAIAYLVGLGIVACHGLLNPPKEDGPGCGWDTDCGGGMCCPYGHICGGPDPAGFQRCEPGYCCAGPDPLWGASADAGGDAARHVVPARRSR